MLKFFKKIVTESAQEEFIFNPVVLLMIEIAKADGNLDHEERNKILQLMNDYRGESNIKKSFDEYLDHSDSSSSMYEWIKNINTEYQYDEKLKMMKKLWSLILVDGSIDVYEENLYFKIGNLLKIKRSHLVKIKAFEDK